MNPLTETFIVAFTTFFATIGPVDVAVLYAAMTHGSGSRDKKVMALRGSLIAFAILASFAFGGRLLLETLGISLAALKVAGGVLLLLIAIDMVFARNSGMTSTTDEEQDEAVNKPDVSVFPLATPLIAGPGAMGATMLLMANHQGDRLAQGAVFAALVAVLLLTLFLLLLGSQVQRLLGVTGMHVISRVFGVLLSALAVQFMFDGLGESGLFG
jgi:multiple antibiotic resistance protein